MAKYDLFLSLQVRVINGSTDSGLKLEISSEVDEKMSIKSRNRQEMRQGD